MKKNEIKLVNIYLENSFIQSILFQSFYDKIGNCSTISQFIPRTLVFPEIKTKAKTIEPILFYKFRRINNVVS